MAKHMASGIGRFAWSIQSFLWRNMQGLFLGVLAAMAREEAAGKGQAKPTQAKVQARQMGQDKQSQERSNF